GPLLALALFKEGQRRFFEVPTPADAPAASSTGAAAGDVLAVDPAHVSWNSDAEAQAATARAAEFLAHSIQAGCKDAHAAYLLGLAYKRLGKIEEARTAFARSEAPDADFWLQRGLLSLQQRQLPQAEEEFSKAQELAPKSFAATAN